jgi:hypothetical protein
MAPLRAHFVFRQLRLEPGDVALRIFPGSEPPRPRHGAEERDEVRAGADVDDVEVGGHRTRALHGLDGTPDDQIVVGMRLAVIVLEVGLGIELGPAIIRIARGRAPALFRRFSCRHEMPLGSCCHWKTARSLCVRTV